MLYGNEEGTIIIIIHKEGREIEMKKGPVTL
jgi:hypothetical protein